MKATAASTLAVAAMAGFASAQQQAGTGLPSCALCITNMVSLHANLGCEQPDDISCLCSKPDFGFGIRDCAVQACENVQQAERVISEGKDICGRAEPASPVATSAAVSAASKTLEGVEVIYTTSGSILQTTTAVIGTLTPATASASGSATGEVDVASSEQDVASSLASVSSSLESSASASASGFTSREGKQQGTATDASGTPASTSTGRATSSSQSAAGAMKTAGVGLGIVGGLVGLFL
ncbi:hypothetical protein QBC40DRAFT_319653 [Triangularia verruculosa]|uniref:CFEM domain-containing protein n=1 Tax=Triangularia verruculosa TaxID=2587418 RepID=A0AAN7AZI0_9PEZI|nr:hypothetical protein QBC40DRAFT_319653 [Triangularia verruculosa]